MTTNVTVFFVRQNHSIPFPRNIPFKVFAEGEKYQTEIYLFVKSDGERVQKIQDTVIVS